MSYNLEVGNFRRVQGIAYNDCVFKVICRQA